jgi:hypothetical protein
MFSLDFLNHLSRYPLGMTPRPWQVRPYPESSIEVTSYSGSSSLCLHMRPLYEIKKLISIPTFLIKSDVPLRFSYASALTYYRLSPAMLMSETLPKISDRSEVLLIVPAGEDEAPIVLIVAFAAFATAFSSHVNGVTPVGGHPAECRFRHGLVFDLKLSWPSRESV